MRGRFYLFAAIVLLALAAHLALLTSRVSQVAEDAMRSRLASLGASVFAPSPRLATDNAAMIARAGLYHLERGERSGLDLNAFASLAIPGLAD